MEHSLNETDRQMVRRENGRSRRGGSSWAAKVPTDICCMSPPSAAANHVPASVISQCQVGSEKTTFHGLHYVGLCILSRNRMSPSPNFIQGTIFPRNWGISRKRETQRSDKASSAVESQCRAAEQRGFLPTSASAAARNYLGSPTQGGGGGGGGFTVANEPP